VPCHRSPWELDNDRGRKLVKCIILKNIFVSGKSVRGDEASRKQSPFIRSSFCVETET